MERGKKLDGKTFESDKTEILMRSDGGMTVQFQNETGEGTLTMYEVFPGVILSYNDFHMAYYDSEYQPDRSLFCIDHCREGRLEYTAAEDAYAYVAAGDLKLDKRLTHTGRFEMPLSHYHGAMISMDMEKAPDSVCQEMKDFPVDLRALEKKFCKDKYPFVLHAQPAVEHIFGELYAVPEKIRMPYYKIKILELLLYLDALELPESAAEQPYFYKTQVEKVKAIHDFLADHMEQSYTQEALSEQFDISLTAMKQCFKTVYGAPLGAWLLEYRMNRAAVYLKTDTKRSVAEIAGMVGYDSPSKFAMAFRRVMGLSPLEYRKQRKIFPCPDGTKKT